ncbi:MAG: hypothetical protein MUO95_01855 [Methanoregula sp.]|nr:hypothetical protein [Methanoregula sp.]
MDPWWGVVCSGVIRPLTVSGWITGKTVDPNLAMTGKIASLPTTPEPPASRSAFAVRSIIWITP